MAASYITQDQRPAVPIRLVEKNEFLNWITNQPSFIQNWIKHNNFTAEPDSFCVIPDGNGGIKQILLGVGSSAAFWHVGGISSQLSDDIFTLDPHDFANKEELWRARLAWGLGQYQYNAYRKLKPFAAKLKVEEDYASLQSWLSTIYLVRDLINTPTEDMGPADLAQAVRLVGKEYDARVEVIEGDDLLAQGFRAIHAVGRAGERPPCLIDLKWGDPRAPLVTLVGKGVCFDTGGLDLKPAVAMALMKKDMGGAANALGLARMIMAYKLPIRLRLLIPAVENNVSSNSYRPGDVIFMRNGLSVEVTNTDAEGRLILADALVEACSEDPELVIDFATLTGDARRALGPELPALFCNNEDLAHALLSAGKDTKDPLWQLPLVPSYENYLMSEIADLANSSRVPMAGAIVAGLFLQRFIGKQIHWAHLDLFAWNMEALPGRPFGGEAQAIRGVFHYLEKKFK